jgi:hypothetical protein
MVHKLHCKRLRRPRILEVQPESYRGGNVAVGGRMRTKQGLTDLSPESVDNFVETLVEMPVF